MAGMEARQSGPEGAQHRMSSEGESLAVFAWCRVLGWMVGWVDGCGSCEVGLALVLAVSQRDEGKEGGKVRDKDGAENSERER